MNIKYSVSASWKKQRILMAITLPLTALVLAVPGFAWDKKADGKSGMETVFAPDVIKSEIAYLASDELHGRGSGEPGNEKAAQYVAQEFKRDGLKPLGTNKEREPGASSDGSGYYQPFTFVAGRVVGKNNMLKIRYGKLRSLVAPASAKQAKVTKVKVSQDKLNQDKATVTGISSVVTYGKQDFEPSSVSGAGSAEGEIVFVGYGINAPKANHVDYQSSDIKDKVILMLAGSPKDDPHSPLADYADIYRKTSAVRDLGAKAVLIVMPKPVEGQQAPRSTFDDVSETGIPVLRLHRQAAETLIKSSGKSLDTILADADNNKNVSYLFPIEQTAQLRTDIKKVTKVTANVVGLIEGSDPVLKNEYVVIGAHVDHLGMGGPGSLAKSSAPAIHHGADDNASGAAGVMQMARYFTQRIGTMARTKRSIILMCFSGEELGLLGSDYYVKHPIMPLEQTVAMLNMDMVGRLRDNKLTVIGSGTAKEWDSLLDDTNKTAGFTLAKSESGFGASDQQSFYTKNIPVLFFFTGTHTQYHTPEDTVDLINADGESHVLQLVANCTQRIANAPDRPAFQRIQTPDQNAPSRGLRVYFGSVPDYAAMVEGVQLNGVREGSPAEKAGLKAGDIIVKFGERVVKNVYDYTYALQDCRPGDMVQVVVKRGEKTLILNVTLAARPE